MVDFGILMWLGASMLYGAYLIGKNVAYREAESQMRARVSHANAHRD